MSIMKKTHEFLSLIQSKTLIKATTCLLLVAGAGVSPVYATQEKSDFVSTTGVNQSSVTMKGRVKDVHGEPIIGASIVEKGTTNGTVTDLDGNYSLKVKPGSIVTISYVGFVTQTVKAGGSVNVTLQEDQKSLNEIVVIGYGTQRKGDITSAITSVKAEDFSKGNIKDAGDLIKGKVAGLTISNGSGDPSAASSIRLRGIISLEGGNTPLVLVDGIESSLSTVAPENIESIDVLKDASAAAIYGTRGAAGVIIITTKNGKRDSNTTVNYSGYMSLSAFGKKLDMMDGTDVRNALTEFNDKGYDTDWLDAVTRTAFTHNHNVIISGGNKDTSYSADFTYRNQQGVFINTFSDEMRFNGALSHWFLNDMLKVSFNIMKRWHKNGPVDAASTQVYRQAIMRNPTKSEKTIERISIFRKNIIQLNTMFKPQLRLFHNFESGEIKGYVEDMEDYWGNILDFYQKMWDMVDDYGELVDGLSNTFDSLQANRTNEIMRMLTIISTIVLPLTFITGLYGMNVELPLSNYPIAFWFILAICLLTIIGLLLFFRRKRWM